MFGAASVGGRSSAGAGDDAGGVQQGVAKPFRFSSGEIPSPQQVLAPDEKIVGEASTASSVRHAVGVEATSPNRLG